MVHRGGDRGAGDRVTDDAWWAFRYSPAAILTALTLRAVFRLAYRQAEGLLGFVVSLLGSGLRVADHTTLSRRAATLDVPRPGNADAGADRETLHLLVDSTGPSI